MGYRIINGVAHAIGNFDSLQRETTISTKKNTASFQDILNDVKTKEQGYKLSKHAVERLNEINFTNEDMENIGEGFNLAENKGAKNSVMIYKDVALIASIENRTLITAIEKDRAKDNVFTNVDSVVIL